MFSEQIKKEISDQLDKRFISNDEISRIKLNSKYKVLLFGGVSDGTTLTRRFTVDDIAGKNLLIKSIRIVPYYIDNGNIDTWLFDGVTNTVETIQAQTRIERLFDSYSQVTYINVLINGSFVPIFPAMDLPTDPVITAGYPLDIFVDNIYYKFPQLLQSFDMQIVAEVLLNIQTNARGICYVKVMVECYLY